MNAISCFCVTCTEFVKTRENRETTDQASNFLLGVFFACLRTLRGVRVCLRPNSCTLFTVYSVPLSSLSPRFPFQPCVTAVHRSKDRNCRKREKKKVFMFHPEVSATLATSRCVVEGHHS